MLGAVLVPIAMVMAPVLSDVGTGVYDQLRPVVEYWTVNDSKLDGDDLLLSGTMIKRRDCMFMPPTLARDTKTGRNFMVESGSPTAGKTWAASDYPQAFGPWRVRGAAGKTLVFINIYSCGDSRPSAVELGVHVAENWK